jgi:hypothetical protein
MLLECINLADDALWRAIAENTNAVSELLHQQAELDFEIAIMSDDLSRSALMRSYLDTMNKFEREYRACTAELRRRYPTAEANDRPWEIAEKTVALG